MKLNAVSVCSSNIKKTVNFYTLIGFNFDNYKQGDDHVEPTTSEGSARLMIDSMEMIREINGEYPKPGNHSCFAIEFVDPKEIDEVVTRLKAAEFKIVKEPWDAFWGQRYAIVEDPDGFKLDLYSTLQ